MTEAPSFFTDANHWKRATAAKVSVIVDAADYFHHVREAMMRAEHDLLLIGWDFDTRVKLDRFERRHKHPNDLGTLLLWLADAKPNLNIRILKWDVGALKMLKRGSALLTAARWAMHDRITFKLDGAHPTGASHHQKVVVIDDTIAFCGGIDMTDNRWDTRDHRDEEPRRKSPNGKPHAPWHDVTMALTGPIAVTLGELARDRWAAAGGDRIPPSPPVEPIWPEGLEPDFRDVEVAVSRTRGETDDCEEVREIEAMYVDLINAAERSIYIETQYFASRKIAETIAKRLAEPDGPDFVVINPETADGWLEEKAMGAARVRLWESLKDADTHDRFRIYTPVTAGGEPIYVHAKVLIVDDRLLRIGSSNMNNRSLALDSECDVTIDAHDDAERRQTIRGLRNGLLAEHLGIEAAEVAAALDADPSLVRLVESRRGEGRTLMPYVPPDIGDIETFLADNEILDPDGADAMLDPIAKRGLFRGRWLRSPD